MPHPDLISDNAALLIVDMQEAFRTPIGNFSVIAGNIARAAAGFGILGLKVLVTEQYPAGLGPTAEEIRYTLPESAAIIEKTAFSSFAEPNIRAALDGVRDVILGGVETHVCVNQTAHHLLESGFKVHILHDCVGSRFEHDRAAGLAKMTASGAVPCSVEMALFELMRDSRHPSFREVQSLIK